MENLFKLANWLVNPKLCVISNAQETINLEPKAMTLLVVLAEAEGELVSRDELFESVWPNQYVTDQALNTLISSLRKSLAHQPADTNIIETRAKLGYRLSQPVQWETPKNATKAATQTTNPIDTKLWLLLLTLILTVLFFANKFYNPRDNASTTADINSANNDYQVIRYLVNVTLSFSKSELDSTGKALCENYSYELLSKAIYKDGKWMFSNAYYDSELKYNSRPLANFEETYQIEYAHSLGKEVDTMTITFDAKGEFTGSGEMKIYNNQDKLVCAGRALYIGTKM